MSQSTIKVITAAHIEAIVVNAWFDTINQLASAPSIVDDYATHVAGSNSHLRRVVCASTGQKMRLSKDNKVIISKPETAGGAIDRALLEGATMDQLKAIRGAVDKHIGDIRRIFGKQSVVRSEGGVYTFVRPL